MGLGLGASGIVGTLIVAGIILKTLNVSEGFGELAIGGGVTTGLILAGLGILGVLKRIGF